MEKVLKVKIVTKKLPKVINGKDDLMRSVKEITTNEADKVGWGLMEYQLRLTFLANEIFGGFAALFNVIIDITPTVQTQWGSSPKTVKWRIKSRDYGYTRQGTVASTFEAYHDIATTLRIALDTLAIEGKTTVEDL